MSNLSDNHVKCKCELILAEDEFIRHFSKCEEFRKHFKNFDAQFGELLKHHSEPKENLLIIRILLKQYVNLLDRKIRMSFDGRNGYSVQNVNNPINSNSHNSQNSINRELNLNNVNFSNNSHKVEDNSIKIDNNIDFKNVARDSANNDNLRRDNVDMNYGMKFDSVPGGNGLGGNNFIEKQQQEYIVECCQICKDLNYTYLECLHQICVKCFRDYAHKDFRNMKCTVCQTPTSEETKKIILGEEYEKLDYAFLMGAIGSVIDCPQCKEKIVFEKGGVDYNIKNDKNEKLSKEAAEHYAHNRCRCPSCKIDFCAGCRTTPYHIGKTCEEQVQFVVAKRCRFDDAVIQARNRGPADDVCNNPECVATFKTACNKLLKCGHKCFGCKTEKVCPPCLNKECPDYVNIFDQDADSYCNICFTEGLGNSPVVLLSCNHYIHYKCIGTRLSKKWIGPKITFSHCLCPQCNAWVNAPNVPDIQAMINENKTLYEDISKKALERLKFEGLQKDPKLTDPNSRWHKNELAYAMNRLSYYMCYQCKKPYFAGLRECGDGPNVNNNNPNREYDPKDLICGAHVNNYGVAGITDCKTHGKEFIEYKCKFCCNIASWFCWGTTHFCEDCHARQCKGDYVSKYSRDKLPKCDPSKCMVKVKHPDNGEEFALGCSVCRNNQDNIRNF